MTEISVVCGETDAKPNWKLGLTITNVKATAHGKKERGLAGLTPLI
jgi:hypothetical protein